MTATQDTNLTSPSLGQAKKELLRIQALQEGVPGLGLGRAPLPLHHSCPFLHEISLGFWSVLVSPEPEFHHHLPLLTCLKCCLPGLSSNCYYRGRSPWAAQIPSLINSSAFWRPAFLYSSAPRLVFYMGNIPSAKIPELLSRDLVIPPPSQSNTRGAHS